MSVIVKDMEMPKCCFECLHCDCNFTDEKTGKVKDWMCLAQLKLCEKDMTQKRPAWCPLVEYEDKVEMNIFDVEEVHHNCTVQIWKNSVTGECSVGWYKEGENDED